MLNRTVIHHLSTKVKMLSRYKKVETKGYLEEFTNIPKAVEKLTRKGNAGRVCVIGGSFEYTGAPYFCSISALLSGADLTYNICTSHAAIPLKSYDPNLMVMPFLDSDSDEFYDKFFEIVHRFRCVVIGPGLGRDRSVIKNILTASNICHLKDVPMVIDADGLYIVKQLMGALAKYPARLILTPNARELTYLVESEEDIDSFLHSICGTEVALICKGSTDKIYVKSYDNFYLECKDVGSVRRCGGQGDMLTGILATFLCNPDIDLKLICYAATFLTRKANEYGFRLKNRSMLVTDMIEVLPNVLKDYVFTESVVTSTKSSSEISSSDPLNSKQV